MTYVYYTEVIKRVINSNKLKKIFIQYIDNRILPCPDNHQTE